MSRARHTGMPAAQGPPTVSAYADYLDAVTGASPHL